MHKQGTWITAYLAALAVVGAALVIWLTPHGAGVSPDSTFYLESTQSLLAGEGYAVDGVPITHFPPLYPTLLAFTGILQPDLVQAARLFNAILFGLNLALIGWLAYLAAGRKLWVSGLAALFALSAEPILELHAWAWSEPLFITLLLAGLLILVRYVVEPGRIPLVASALLLGLAVITRYIGMGLLPAGALLIYLGRPRRDRLQGLRAALVWLALACLPLALFIVRNLVLLGTATDRRLAVHPMALSEYTAGLTSTLSRMLALDPLLARAAAALIMFIAVYLILPLEGWGARLRNTERRLEEFAIPFACLLFCAIYLPFLYISLSFLDASTPLDARILSPVLVLLVVGGIPGVATLARRLHRPLAWWGFVATMIVLILLRAPASIPIVRTIRADGLGYTSAQWTGSDTIRSARTLPSGGTIYSNAPDIVRFLDGRRALPLPALTNPLTLQPNPSYGQQLEAMCNGIAGGSAYVVYFEAVQLWNLPDKATLETACGLPILYQLPDGTVYGGI